MLDLTRYPALAAHAPTADVSERYTFISTLQVADVLRRDHRLVPVSVDMGRRSQRGVHLVRFRHEGAATNREYVPEIALRTAHDGTSAFQMFSGIFRFVCANGLVIGDFERTRIVHLGGLSLRDRVAEAVTSHTSKWLQIESYTGAMRAHKMDQIEQIDFARKAADLRWPHDTHRSFSADGDYNGAGPLALLAARRPEDRGDDLWTVFNRVQENLTRAGTPLRARRARGITDRNAVALNVSLWNLAREYA